MVVKDFELAAVVLGGAGDVPVPVVGDSRHKGEGELLAGAADEDGRVGLLDGLGLEGGVTELVVPSVEVSPVFGPEETDDADGLFQAADAFADAWEGDAVGVVLGAVPARAEAEDDTAVACVVHGGGDFCEGGGMSESGAGDEGAEAWALHNLGKGGEETPGVSDVAVFQGRSRGQVVVVDPEVVEAQAARVPARRP